MPGFTTYILYSPSLNKFYIGYTSMPVEERLAKHLQQHNGFTAKAKDWQIVHTEFFESKSEAMRREKQLKSWKSTLRILSLISGTTE